MEIVKKLLSRLMKIPNDLLTGKDNLTHDLGRWAILGCLLAALGHDVYQLHCDPKSVKVTDLALAFSSILGTGGALLKLKEKSEPDPPQGGTP